MNDQITEQHSMGVQKVFDKETADKIKADAKPHQVFELGNGLEVWLVDIALLLEQTINARTMTDDAFLQLSSNIGSRGGLESLPLCGMTEAGVEIISGHHRVRAARKADVTQIWVLVDVSGLTRDQIRSKQLAHNSLQGTDNLDLVKQIFESIGDIEARIAAYVEPDMEKLKNNFTLNQKDLQIQFDSKVTVITFLPAQYEVFKDALSQLAIQAEVDDVYLAGREEYDLMVEVLSEVSDKYDIRSTPTLFAKMAEIVSEHLKSEPEDDTSID